jgi:HSP20 family protein
MALMKLNPTWPTMDVAYPTRLGRLLEQMFDTPFAREENGSLFTGWMPAMDVIEEKDMIRLVAELPGVKPEDVKISLENNILTIQGEKKKEEEVKDEKVRRYERTYGAFERTFTLPATINPEKIVARFDAGLLTIQLPKIEAAKPRQISVKIEK